MFPLFQKKFPATTEELRAALENCLARLVRIGSPGVRLSAAAFPAMEELSVNLSGGQLRTDLPKPAPLVEKTPSQLRAQSVSIDGERLSLGGAALDFNLQARDVAFAEGRDQRGDAMLLLQSAAEGHLTLAIARADLESIITQIATMAAAQHGVNIEQVHLTLQEAGPGAIDGKVELSAKKLFMRATVRLTGRATIDDKLTARLSDLNCSGEGALGSLACGVLQPQLQKWNGRSFSLQALPLGELAIRDLKVEASDGLRIRAEFGARPAGAT